MVGAGGALGATSDAGQIFKSVLARGEVRMIAATTLSEYKEHIQDDEALARRFRCVQVAEPTIEETRQILYQLRPRLERNYSVEILDETIEMALDMSPATCDTCVCPTKRSAGSTPQPCGRRWTGARR